MRITDIAIGERYRLGSETVVVYKVGVPLITQTAPGVAWRFRDGTHGKGSARDLRPIQTFPRD